MKLEGPVSFNEDRLAEREGEEDGREHLSLRDAVVAALRCFAAFVRPSVRSVGGNDGRIAPFAGKKWTASSN